MRTISDIIDGLGGNAHVARSIDAKPSTVGEFKRRNSIPIRYWAGLIALSEQTPDFENLSNDELVSLHATETAA